MKRPFTKTGDNFRIDWDDREVNCEVGVSLRVEKEGRSNYVHLEVNLARKMDKIEDVLEEREKIRFQIENDDLTGVLYYKGRWDYKEVIDFLRACQENGLNMTKEIKYIKKDKLETWIISAQDRLDAKKKYLEDYKEGTERYVSALADVDNAKKDIDYLISLK